MMRAVNVLALAVTVTAAFGLYKLKYNTSLAQQTLARIENELTAEREAIRVLNAEWSYLNRPQRIQALADKHLPLQPIDPGQVAQMKDVPFRPVLPDDDVAATDRSNPVGGPELPLDRAQAGESGDEENDTRGGNAGG